jgi:hypothetical protein
MRGLSAAVRERNPQARAEKTRHRIAEIERLFAEASQAWWRRRWGGPERADAVCAPLSIGYAELVSAWRAAPRCEQIIWVRWMVD